MEVLEFSIAKNDYNPETKEKTTTWYNCSSFIPFVLKKGDVIFAALQKRQYKNSKGETKENYYVEFAQVADVHKKNIEDNEQNARSKIQGLSVSSGFDDDAPF
jgi:hypothetical protein